MEKNRSEKYYPKKCKFFKYDFQTQVTDIYDSVGKDDCNEIEDEEKYLSVPLCEISQCKTAFGNYCSFPFRFAGRTYTECLTLGNNDTSWCSTKTDEFGNHVIGFEEECQSTCSFNNCPSGYHAAHPENTCYKVNISYHTF